MSLHHHHSHDHHHQGHVHAEADPGHAPDHSHVHAVGTRLTRAFAIGVALNLGFVVVETGFGFWADSLALLADASHNFGDVIGLLLAWGAAALASRKPSPRFTYGLGSSTILAALANAMLLLIAVGGIVWAAVQRLSSGSALLAINENVVIWVAAVGIVINTATALLFYSGQKHDLNARGAFLHMAGDAAVSLGVVIAGLVIRQTGWEWLDPVVSLVIAVVILISTWELLKESTGLALQAVPHGVEVNAVRSYLNSLPGVRDTHDLHIWAISTSNNALTAHLVMPQGHPGDTFLAQAAREIERRFQVGHVTLQVETGTAQGAPDVAPCKQANGCHA